MQLHYFVGINFWKVGLRKLYAVPRDDIDSLADVNNSADDEANNCFDSPPTRKKQRHSKSVEDKQVEILAQVKEIHTSV